MVYFSNHTAQQKARPGRGSRGSGGGGMNHPSLRGGRRKANKVIHRSLSTPLSIKMLAATAFLLLLVSKTAHVAATFFSDCPKAKGGVSMGTTIVAVKYSGGIVVGADTRTSVSGYVSNRLAAKLTIVLDCETDAFVVPSSACRPLRETGADTTSLLSPDSRGYRRGSTCCVCRSGSAADTQYLADLARTDLLAASKGRMGTVSDVANLLKNVIRNEPDLSASLICAGYDHMRDEGTIYSISPGGTLMEESEWAVQGSGSGYILGYLDANYPEGTDAQNWSEEEACSFVAKVVGLAVDRDGSSGGFVKMFVINRYGKREITHMLEKVSGEGDDDIVKSRRRKASVLNGFAPPVYSTNTSP